MEDMSFEESPRSYKGSSKRLNKFLLVGALIVVVALLIFGITRLIGGQNEEELETSPTPTEFVLPTDTPTPEEEEEEEEETTPTPEEEENTEISIQVLNGSGESGVAATVAQVLRDAGYTNVTTGNADSFDYEGVTIQVKSSERGALPGLRDTLEEEYTITSATSDLEADNASDAIVIIGS